MPKDHLEKAKKTLDTARNWLDNAHYDQEVTRNLIEAAQTEALIAIAEELRSLNGYMRNFDRHMERGHGR